MKNHITGRMIVAAILAIALMLGAAGLAEEEWHLFESTRDLTGRSTPANAGSVMQRDLYQGTVNNV